MAGSLFPRRPCFFPHLIVASALLAAAPFASAQTCGGKLPTPDGKSVTGGDKFRLITQACPGVAEPITIQRAPQLDLYERGSVTINMSEPVLEEPAPRLYPAPVQQTVPYGAERDVQRIQKLTPALTAAAREYNLDPLFLHAIAHVESRHNSNAVSPAGARGAMQVMPATAKSFGFDGQSLNADSNLRASAAYIRKLRTRYGDDLHLVLAAYNAGEGAVEKYGRSVPPFPETQAYVRDVLAVYRRLTATFSVASDGALLARNDKTGDK
jgi:hypothetical protein